MLKNDFFPLEKTKFKKDWIHFLRRWTECCSAKVKSSFVHSDHRRRKQRNRKNGKLTKKSFLQRIAKDNFISSLPWNLTGMKIKGHVEDSPCPNAETRHRVQILALPIVSYLEPTGC